MSYTLGIDLGTTYTAAAVSRDGRTEICQLGSRAASIPSVVLLRADGEVLTGEAAERRALSEPGRVAREFKRRLGDPVPLLLGGTPYSAEALSAHLLRSVVDQVSQREGSPPDCVVVTHPASYGEYKRDLLVQACRQADLPGAILCSEPEAAALHYASQERIEPGTVIAVYDFGGGTFDAAVLEKSDAGFRQLGQPEGIDRLGGVDFDQAVFAHVMESLEVNAESLSHAEGARAGLAALRAQSRDAKEGLSIDTEATIPVMLPQMQTDVRLTRDEFEALIRPRVEETVLALQRAVRSSGLSMEQIDRILLVGGSSRIPLVGQLVGSRTGRPVVVDAHPKHVIALGAAMLPEAVLVAADAPAEHEVENRAAPAASTPTVAAPPPRSAVPEPSIPSNLPTHGLGTGEKGPGLASRGRLIALASAGLFIVVVVVAAAGFLLRGGGGSKAAAAEISDVRASGNWYSVTFDSSGFTSSENGTFLVFYWEGQDPVRWGVPYWGASPFTGIGVGSAPSGSSRLCVALVTPEGEVDTDAGECARVQ